MNNQEKDRAPQGPIRDREAAREFVATAAHDLREPLRAINASAGLLAELHRDSVDETTNRCLGYLRDGVARMESLIHDVEEYCYEGLRELDPQEVDLETVLRDAQSRLSEELKRNGATVTHDSLPSIGGDFIGLATVFRSLLGNACKFRASAAPRIHIGARRQGAEWVLSIRDNGLGFKPAYAERIFQPFERLNGKEYPGSGLGLALARIILERHGGRIWAESEPGAGSTFWVSLPSPP
jgi:light-regulated signal transduction histidine kinase (bacteriophytochrome)